jgi:hypothetical protein
MNAPIELSEIPEYAAQPINAVEFITADRYAWWRRGADDPEFRKYLGFDRCIATIRKQWYSCIQQHQCAGYDGILGFSQGGGLCAIIAALHQYWYNNTQKSPKQSISIADIIGHDSQHLSTLSSDNFQWLASLKFSIIFSGYISNDSSLEKFFTLQSNASLPFSSTYSLHVYGTADEAVTPERSLLLSQCWTDDHRQLHQHDGVHIVPTQRYDVVTVKDFILQCRKHVEESEEQLKDVFQENMDHAVCNKL